MKTSSVLIVVPDETIRRSLAFLMETEGYNARIADHLPSSADLEDGLADIGCALVDHSAMGREPARLDGLRGKGVPVVMLASHLERMPVLQGVRLLEKPVPGAVVVDAVSAALTESKPPAPATT